MVCQETGDLDIEVSYDVYLPMTISVSYVVALLCVSISTMKLTTVKSTQLR